MKLIDKEVVVAEIERLKEELQDKVETSDFIAGEVFIMNYFLSFLDTLEVKEVDLEKELSYEDYKSFFEKYPDLSDDWGFEEAWTFAKYFFELGLKAQKYETNII